MPALSGRRRSQAYAVAGIAIYALFLVTAPFEHHDLVCHFKTPTHCTSCTSSLVSSDPHTSLSVGASDLADAGRALAFDVLASAYILTVRSTGRSPPAIA